MIKIWNVYHAPIARYGPELKIIKIEFELEIELGPKFFFFGLRSTPLEVSMV